jgi:hypothetical protein
MSALALLVQVGSMPTLDLLLRLLHMLLQLAPLDVIKPVIVEAGLLAALLARHLHDSTSGSQSGHMSTVLSILDGGSADAQEEDAHESDEDSDADD